MDDNRQKQTRSQLLITLAVVGAVGALYALFGCPIKYATGLSCPGCGMTRACLAAAGLHFGRAFHYHPLFLLVPAGLWLFFSKWARARPRLRNIGFGVIGVAFVVTWLVRLLVVKSPVVGWDTPGFWRDISTGFARLRWWAH